MQYLLLHYGYAFLVLGLILEGDATLIAAAILAGQSYFDLRWVVGLAMAVTVGGNELLFHIGAMGRVRGIMRGKKRERVSRWLHSSRSGFLTLLFSRFMWGFRLVIPLAAGALHIRRRRFLISNIVGGIVWVLVLTYFGVALQDYFATLQAQWRHYQPHVAVALFLIGIVIGIGSIPWRLTRRALRQSIPNLKLEHPISIVRPAQPKPPQVANTRLAPPRAAGSGRPIGNPRHGLR